ncbi:glycosyltransferase [Leptospira ognonensis]|uniref:Glycosyltransferase n=1 Tax=Leptospira ognonensis TaxID=2484945 RepID=A0A4R9K642_9LEPT|nr:glycosyltransferase [Leptospira ognonensis]TGL59767.1 glycosyltransferase [Leptospira ognonensis]
MKVLIVNTSDIEGGSAKSALTLHKEFLDFGISSEFLVQTKSSMAEGVTGNSGKLNKLKVAIRSRLDRLPQIFYPNRLKYPFSNSFLPVEGEVKRKFAEADIINLHWVNNGFISLEYLKSLKKPIVWTMHDSWVFTGGCHLPFDCLRYQAKCGGCLSLQAKSSFDLSTINWYRKNKVFIQSNITFVSPSQWLAGAARSSSLLKNKPIETLGNPLNQKVFKPLNQKFAREVLNLPDSSFVLGFGGNAVVSDPNKGFKEVVAVLQSGKLKAKNITLLVFGNKDRVDLKIEGVKIINMGIISSDYLMGLVYSSIDCLLVASKSENFPYVILEALSCGTPSVAFRVGGIPELITHRKNGYLVSPYDLTDYADGINFVYKLGKVSMLKSCASKAAQFEASKIAKKYISLFETLILANGSR